MMGQHQPRRGSQFACCLIGSEACSHSSQTKRVRVGDDVARRIGNRPRTQVRTDRRSLFKVMYLCLWVTSTVASGLDEPFFIVEEVIPQDLLGELQQHFQEKHIGTSYTEIHGRACRNIPIALTPELRNKIYSHFEDKDIATRITKAYVAKCGEKDGEWLESQLKYAGQEFPLGYSLLQDDIESFRKNLNDVKVVLPKIGYKGVGRNWVCNLKPGGDFKALPLNFRAAETVMVEQFYYEGEAGNDGCDEHKDLVYNLLDTKSLPVVISIPIVLGESGVRFKISQAEDSSSDSDDWVNVQANEGDAVFIAPGQAHDVPRLEGDDQRVSLMVYAAVMHPEGYKEYKIKTAVRDRLKRESKLAEEHEPSQTKFHPMKYGILDPTTILGEATPQDDRNVIADMLTEKLCSYVGPLKKNPTGESSDDEKSTYDIYKSMKRLTDETAAAAAKSQGQPGKGAELEQEVNPGHADEQGVSDLEDEDPEA